MTRLALCALLAAAALPVHAEDLDPAAQRVAASLVRQIAGATPRISAASIAPFQESGAAKGVGAGRRFAESLAKHLAGKLQLRDYEALDRTQRERALNGAAPQITAVQALIVGEAAGGDAGAPITVSVRVVAVATGNTVASESAKLGSVVAVQPRERNAVESASVDVAMRKIADQLVDGFAKLPGNVRYRRLAVLPFSETGEEAKKRELGAVVTAELSTSLRRDHGLLLVERAKLQQVMGEIKLGQSGAVENGAEIGKLSDAQALVLGSVAQVGDKYMIDARIVATESAEALASASESVPAANLVAFSSDAVVLRSKKDALFRSVLIPGWGQIYNRESAKGYVFMGGVIGAFGAAAALHMMGQKAEQDYKSYVPPAGTSSADASAHAQQLHDQAESRYNTRNVAIAVGAGVWLLNIFDAYFSGVDGERVLGGPMADGGYAGWTKRF